MDSNFSVVVLSVGKRDGGGAGGSSWDAYGKGR